MFVLSSICTCRTKVGKYKYANTWVEIVLWNYEILAKFIIQNFIMENHSCKFPHIKNSKLKKPGMQAGCFTDLLILQYTCNSEWRQCQLCQDNTNLFSIQPLAPDPQVLLWRTFSYIHSHHSVLSCYETASRGSWLKFHWLSVQISLH